MEDQRILNIQDLVKELQKYNDRPYSIEVRLYPKEACVERFRIVRVDSDEDGLYIEVEE